MTFISNSFFLTLSLIITYARVTTKYLPKESLMDLLLQALIEFIEWKGFKVSDHEIITNYPRRIISELDQESKSKEFELSNTSRDTVYALIKI